MTQLDPNNRNGSLEKSFRLNKARAKLFGVCAGIADYFDVDVTLVRAAFVITTLIGFGSPILLYLAVALIAD